jgi:hypothetical protein
MSSMPQMFLHCSKHHLAVEAPERVGIRPLPPIGELCPVCQREQHRPRESGLGTRTQTQTVGRSTATPDYRAARAIETVHAKMKERGAAVPGSTEEAEALAWIDEARQEDLYTLRNGPRRSKTQRRIRRAAWS